MGTFKNHMKAPPWLTNTGECSLRIRGNELAKRVCVRVTNRLDVLCTTTLMQETQIECSEGPSSEDTTSGHQPLLSETFIFSI